MEFFDTAGMIPKALRQAEGLKDKFPAVMTREQAVNTISVIEEMIALMLKALDDSLTEKVTIMILDLENLVKTLACKGCYAPRTESN